MTDPHQHPHPAAGATEGGDAGASRKRKRKKRTDLVWIILGILILLYPIVATMYNDYQLYKRAQEYSQGVERIEPSDMVQHYIDEARRYNADLAARGHHARPAVKDGSPADADLERYLNTLNAPETNGTIARLKVPSLDIDLPIYHTVNSDVLYRGAGHMYGSDLPVGGDGTNSVISAHTGMVNATMFDNLPRIKDGADIYIEVMGQHLRYQVTGRQVVKPEKYDAVTYEPGKDKITLITCTPYGINSDRLLVEAQRVPLDGTAVDKEWKPTLSWWMIAALAIIALVLFLVWRKERKERKARKEREERKEHERAERERE